MELPAQNLIGKNEADLELQKKEKHQERFFSDQFAKVTSNEYYKFIQSETERRSSYKDFEAMEYYPITAAAMDILAQETATIGEDGSVLKIYSNSKKVKNVLGDLFHHNLNVDSMIYYWSRQLIKYGDNFLLLIFDKENGVTGAKQLPNIEIERKESFNPETQQNIITFDHLSTGQTYSNFQIAHFRMLGDDSRNPYGSSFLEKIRKTVKMLLLAEDSMMINRLTRSVERKVFKIDVGNINDNEIGEYINKIANKFKKVGEVSQATGNTDFRYNVVNTTQDYFIPVRNGSSNTSIDTLNNAGGLDTTNDIDFLRDNLISGLGIPKTFLGFEESAGEGKSLAMLDIRFARKVTRIQQCMIQELNKIAQVHLFLLGMEDELTNFTLSLQNPSTQTEIMKTESLAAKVQAYSSLVTPQDSTQIAPMSETMAKKLVFNMSDDEIIDDLKKQFMERAVGEEFRNKVVQIASSGIFDDMIDKFRENKKFEFKKDKPKEKEGDKKEDDGGGSGGGGLGGLNFGESARKKNLKNVLFNDKDKEDLINEVFMVKVETINEDFENNMREIEKI